MCGDFPYVSLLEIPIVGYSGSDIESRSDRQAMKSGKTFWLGSPVSLIPIDDFSLKVDYQV
jgi:hypothetical protein